MPPRSTSLPASDHAAECSSSLAQSSSCNWSRGVAIALGPGRLLLSLLPALSATVRHSIEIGLGSAMIVAAGLLWRHRSRLAQKDLPNPNKRQKAAILLGATIVVVELPTAFPYFAAIAPVLSSGISPTEQVLALALFNLCFALPVTAILATLLIAGDQAENILTRRREFIQRRWPWQLASRRAASIWRPARGPAGSDRICGQWPWEARPDGSPTTPHRAPVGNRETTLPRGGEALGICQRTNET